MKIESNNLGPCDFINLLISSLEVKIMTGFPGNFLVSGMFSWIMQRITITHKHAQANWKTTR